MMPSVANIYGNLPELSLQIGKSAYLISFYPQVKKTSVNNYFFGSLSNLSCEYIHCEDPKNQDNIAYNFQKLTETVNQIKFPYLSENNLSTFKLVVLNSLFNHLNFNPLNMMIITEEVTFIEKTIRLEGVKIHKWPSQFDQSTLLNFLAQCHNGIILILNPTKKDFEAINSILN